MVDDKMIQSPLKWRWCPDPVHALIVRFQKRSNQQNLIQAKSGKMKISVVAQGEASHVSRQLLLTLLALEGITIMASDLGGYRKEKFMKLLDSQEL